jgi:hypothetical protein
LGKGVAKKMYNPVLTAFLIAMAALFSLRIIEVVSPKDGFKRCYDDQ